MSEAALRGTVRRNLRPYGVLQWIESHMEAGVPDACVCLIGGEVVGWLELKFLPAWPVRRTTPVRLKKFTQEQALWLKGWDKAGGHSWLLLQVAREYLLFRGGEAGGIFQDRPRPREEVYWLALARGEGTFPTRDFLMAMRKK